MNDPAPGMSARDSASGLNAMAVSATLHCLTGCAIGEILGLVIGTAAGLGNTATIVVSIARAFVFGFTLSSLPLLNAGLSPTAAFKVVVAADTVSIATMELVDNLTMAAIPGAMNAGLVNSIFWIGMAVSLVIAFFAAVPVNRYLLARGKGHALTHEFHGPDTAGRDAPRRRIPVPTSRTLVIVIVSFMVGGLVVSAADDLGGGAPQGGGSSRAASR